jgi:hypothetical protein
MFSANEKSWEMIRGVTLAVRSSAAKTSCTAIFSADETASQLTVGV